MFKTFREQKEELGQQLVILIIVIFILLFIGTIVYHFSEKWSYIDSLYFATISLTSRGYSELHPTKWFSVLFSVFYLLIGVGVIVYALSQLVAFYTSIYQKVIHHKINTIL